MDSKKKTCEDESCGCSNQNQPENEIEQKDPPFIIFSFDEMSHVSIQIECNGEPGKLGALIGLLHVGVLYQKIVEEITEQCGVEEAMAIMNSIENIAASNAPAISPLGYFMNLNENHQQDEQ